MNQFLSKDPKISQASSKAAKVIAKQRNQSKDAKERTALNQFLSKHPKINQSSSKAAKVIAKQRNQSKDAKETTALSPFLSRDAKVMIAVSAKNLSKLAKVIT